MTPLTAYFIRHGEKTFLGRKLTTRGIKQAQHLAKYLKKENFDEMISSTMSRSIQTAEIINSVLKIPHIKDPRIKEVNYFDPLKFYKEKTRVLSFYNDLIKRKGKLLVVAHGNINRAFISFILNIPSKNMKIVQIPTCINILERKKTGKINLVTMNETPHLPKNLKIRQRI